MREVRRVVRVVPPDAADNPDRHPEELANLRQVRLRRALRLTSVHPVDQQGMLDQHVLNVGADVENIGLVARLPPHPNPSSPHVPDGVGRVRVEVEVRPAVDVVRVGRRQRIGCAVGRHARQGEGPGLRAGGRQSGLDELVDHHPLHGLRQVDASPLHVIDLRVLVGEHLVEHRRLNAVHVGLVGLELRRVVDVLGFVAHRHALRFDAVQDVPGPLAVLARLLLDVDAGEDAHLRFVVQHPGYRGGLGQRRGAAYLAKLRPELLEGDAPRLLRGLRLADFCHHGVHRQPPVSLQHRPGWAQRGIHPPPTPPPRRVRK